MIESAPRAGGGSRIPDRQNQPHHLNQLRAYTHLYNVAQRWRRLRLAGTSALAVLGPVFALSSIDTHGILAAISATWLILGRTLLVRFEEAARYQAVRTHELFDIGLFELEWNTAVSGAKPIPDDVARASRALPAHPRFNDWYDLELIDADWPLDVLLCQRQAMAWSRAAITAPTPRRLR